MLNLVIDVYQNGMSFIAGYLVDYMNFLPNSSISSNCISENSRAQIPGCFVVETIDKDFLVVGSSCVDPAGTCG